MARRIRWQIVIAATSSLIVLFLITGLALSTTTVSQPLVGGNYVEALIGLPQHVNPLLNNPQQDPSGSDIAALVFDGLTRIGKDGLPDAALAQRWEVDDSGKTYTFHLRHNVTWHDGVPFTASDVLFTLQAIQSNSYTGNPVLASIWRNVLVNSPDDYTVVCTLNAPYAPFPTTANVPILPAHMFTGIESSDWQQSAFAQQPIGTGPYKVDELTHDHALLSANNHYFGGTPFINTIELRFVDTLEMALSWLSRQEIQAVGGKASPALQQLALPRTYRRVQVPLDGYVALSFNMREAPVNDVQVRKALAQAFDTRILVNDVLRGMVAPFNTPLLPGWWAYNPDVSWHTFNPNEAENTLDALGFARTPQGYRERDGQLFQLPLITDGDEYRMAAAQEIARQWDAIGIPVTIESLTSDELRQRLVNHNFVLALHGWAHLGSDPDVFELWHSSQATGGSNYTGMRDSTIDRTLMQGRVERNLMTRYQQYTEFQKRWIELVPGITLYQPLYTFVVQNDVGGLSFEQPGSVSSLLLVGTSDRYRDVARWFVRSSREIRGILR